MNTVTAQAICYTIASKNPYLNLIRGYIVLIMRHLRLSSMSFLFLLWRMSLISQIASALWPFSDPFHILSTHRMKSSLRFEDGKGLRWRKSQKGHFVEKNCSLKKKRKRKKKWIENHYQRGNDILGVACKSVLVIFTYFKFSNIWKTILIKGPNFHLNSVW